MYKIINGNVTAPEGFEAAGVACGIKDSSKRDLALIYSQTICSSAAVFTSNKIKAAPVVASMKQITNKTSRAIVINSGNANACTGNTGLENAEKMVNATAEELGIDKKYVLIASTGIIGKQLPMDNLLNGIKQVVKEKSKEGGSAAAKAILTTDKRNKEIAVEINTSNGKVKIGGIAKGSGMIAPNLSLPHATMIGVVTSDVEISKSNLSELLSNASDNSFNMISVDGCESTNDCVFALANGISKVNYLDIKKDFDEAFEFICKELAKKIAADGEGATKLIEVNVNGAESDDDARKIAKSIVKSDLVKAASFGNDPNWGRVVAATGSSGAGVDENNMVLKVQSETVYKSGVPVDFDKSSIAKKMKKDELIWDITVGSSSGKATAWGCDLSEKYVKINAEYST